MPENYPAPDSSKSQGAVKHHSLNFYLLIASNLILIAAIIFGVYVIFQQHKTGTITKNNVPIPTSAIPTLNPNSPTANRYFPVKSNAFDFRDGNVGAFVLTTQKNGATVSVRWTAPIRVTGVSVYNLGKLNDLTDDKAVFTINVLNPSSFAQIQRARRKNPKFKPSPPPLPSMFLSSPYRIGDSQQGYYLLPAAATPDQIFVSGTRYTIQVDGLDTTNHIVTGTFTFTD